MKYKLIDFRPGEVEEVETGTCELCFGTMFICNEVFVFEDENGKEYEVESCEWDWGYPEEIDIPNVVDFAAWLDDQEVEDEMSFSTLYNLARDYRYSLEDEE